MKKMSKQKSIGLILVLGVFLFLFLYKYEGTRVEPRLGDTVGYLTTVSETGAEEVLNLKAGDVYRQTVVGTRDEIAGFSIRFGTYGQQVNGKLKAAFSDASGEKIYGEETFEAKDLVDNQYHSILLDDIITDGFQKEYEISLEVLEKILPVLENQEDYSNDALYELLCGFAKENGYKNGQILWPIRTALSGKQMTPAGATEILEVLGKEESLKRIEAAVEKLK